MSIQDWLGIWWMSGIVLPVFFTVVVGGLVSLWAGFVVADLLTYRQTMREAANFLHAALTKKVEGIQTYLGVNDYVLQLRDLKQPERADMLWDIGTRFIDTLQQKTILARLVAAKGVWPKDLENDITNLRGDIQFVRCMPPHYRRLFLARFDVVWNFHEERYKGKVH